MIYYVLTEEEWKIAKEEEEYWPVDFDKRGFIPCVDIAHKDQLIAERDLDDQPLLLLTIDADKLESVIIYEDIHEFGYMSPHVYGYINLDAITNVQKYKANIDSAS